MKTLTLFFLIVCTTVLTANAQITQGNWMVGGSGDYSNKTLTSDEGEKAKFETITVKPSVGYFIGDKFVIGGNLRFNNIGRFYQYGVGLLSRYYFLETEKKINLFAQVHYDYVYNVSDKNASSQFYGAKIGQVIFFNNVAGLEFAIEYEKGKLLNASSDTIKAVIGFQIHLEKI